MVAYPGEAVYEFADGATWRSGYATVCKTVYSGSIPDVASTFEINGLGSRFSIGFQAAEWLREHAAATGRMAF